MKKTLLSIGVLAITILGAQAQGRVAFNNITSSNLISIDPFFSLPGEGLPGALLGANYSIQLLWAPQGTYTYASFLSAVIGSSAPIAFFGVTGNAASGAGFFDGGTVPNPEGTSMPPGTYTMMARAWFNNGQFFTYDQAASHNRGVSAFFDMVATASPTGANDTIFPSFQVPQIPEPSVFALAGLGVAALLLFRRPK